MAKRMAISRLRKEAKDFHRDPPPYIYIGLNEQNLLEWDYLLEGPPDTPYQGGWYHGRVRFPSDYPTSPPEIVMFTPSGRFKISTPLCLSMSNFHPESWLPSWSVATILKGLLSFMCEETPTQGSVETSVAEKKALAQQSAAHNRSNATFRKLFPEFDTIVAEAGRRDVSGERRPPVPSSDEVAKEAQKESGGAAAAAQPPCDAAAPPKHADPAQGDPPPAPPVGVGSRVRLSGLAARADLNGQEAVVLEMGERLTVELEGGVQVKVRERNIETIGTTAPPP
eukprot:Hpha_TRINITY_DN22732_c0_g1::TRINITY_DN22732_c0_g1_i1::g.34224::m.34224/K04554/UBE2J2, NCUBE2, UBC6; ubiquitin-conjugating enzyme E2 J2